VERIRLRTQERDEGIVVVRTVHRAQGNVVNHAPILPHARRATPGNTATSGEVLVAPRPCCTVVQ